MSWSAEKILFTDCVGTEGLNSRLCPSVSTLTFEPSDLSHVYGVMTIALMGLKVNVQVKVKVLVSVRNTVGMGPSSSTDDIYF